MNSTDFNKIAGAGLGALLIFLLLNFFSGQIYGTREVGGHHGEEVLAFALAIETEGAGEAAEEPAVDYLTLVAAADPGAGESIFRACSACHKLEEGANAVGPHLYDVVGRDIAAVDGFSYSDALMAAEGDWTLEHLSGFLENPKAWAPGTKMSYAGLEDPEDRVNLIAYLNEVGGTPIDLAEGLEPVAAVADAGTAIPDPSLSPGVGPGPGVNPPGEAVEGAPASGESAGIEAASEAAAVEESAQAAMEGGPTPAEPVEGQAAEPVPGAVVTEVNPVDVEEEDIEVESTTPMEIEEEADPASAEALPQALEPGETRDDPRAEPPVEAQPEQTPPGEAPAAGPGGPAGPVPASEAYTEQEGAPDTPPDEQLAAAPAAEEAGAAAGDAAAGEKIFRRCAACHKLEEGAHGIGPSLHGVVGRDVAAIEDYTYSDAMAAHEGDWTVDHLSAYLENPKAVVPGTKMAFAGLKDEQDRLDVITYLQEAGGQ